MGKIIFSYKLFDAWYKEISSIEILDIENENVICFDKDSSNTYTIEKKEIDRIINIIENKAIITKIDDIETAPIISFSFKQKLLSVKIRASLTNCTN